MSKLESRLADLERREPAELQKVVIIGEGETPPADADMVIELCSPKVDANGRALAGE